VPATSRSSASRTVRPRRRVEVKAYLAHNDGIPIHVWVDETRPRNQGASLTAWELSENGVPHTVIVDNAGGHLKREGLVDLCIVGTDRTTAGGDVANKIGTYLKALAARDNDVPFYVALPSPTIDWELDSGAAIPIERRDAREVTHIEGWTEEGRRVAASLTPADSPAANYAFDVTPPASSPPSSPSAASAPLHARDCWSCSPSGDGGSLENSAAKDGSGRTTQPRSTERQSHRR
jgi:hypothetical protein